MYRTGHTSVEESTITDIIEEKGSGVKSDVTDVNTEKGQPFILYFIRNYTFIE